MKKKQKHKERVIDVIKYKQYVGNSKYTNFKGE